MYSVAISEILKTTPNLRNPGRIKKILKKKVDSYNCNGINFQCEFSDIDKIEKNNNFSINVFGYNEEESLFKTGNKKYEIFPLKVSKNRFSINEKGEEIPNKVVNLLMISEEYKKQKSEIFENENAKNGENYENERIFGKKYYTLIKSMSRLFSNQVNKNKEKLHICNYCLQHFRNERSLNDHLEYSSKYKCGKTEYPNKGEKLKFKNYEKIHDVPFVIYADWECYLESKDKNIGDNTKQFQNHEPSGYCYLIKCFDDNLFKPKLVRYTKKSKDEDVSLKFVKSLENNVKKIHEKFKFQKK